MAEERRIPGEPRNLTTLRFSVLVGLVIGVVWAAVGIVGALECAAAAIVAGVVGVLVSRGAIDLGAVIGRRDDD